MRGINKVVLVGHVGKKPELRKLENDISVASFPLATSDMGTQNGVRTELTEWHNVVMWRGLAECAAKYLDKGRLIYLEGKIRTRMFDDKNGHRKQTTEILAESFTILGRKNDFDAAEDLAAGNLSISPQP